MRSAKATIELNIVTRADCNQKSRHLRRALAVALIARQAAARRRARLRANKRQRRQRRRTRSSACCMSGRIDRPALCRDCRRSCVATTIAPDQRAAGSRRDRRRHEVRRLVAAACAPIAKGRRRRRWRRWRRRANGALFMNSIGLCAVGVGGERAPMIHDQKLTHTSARSSADAIATANARASDDSSKQKPLALAYSRRTFIYVEKKYKNKKSLKTAKRRRIAGAMLRVGARV